MSDQKCTELEAALNAATEHLTTLEQNHSQMLAEMKAKTQQLAMTAKDQLQQKTARLEEAETRRLQDEEAFQRLMSDHETVLRGLEEEQNVKLRDLNEQLAVATASLAAERRKHEHGGEQSETQIESLRRQLVEAEELLKVQTARVDAAEEKCSATEATMEDMLSQSSAFQSDVHEVQSNLEKLLDSKTSELKSVQQQSVEQNERHEGTIETLRQQIKALEESTSKQATGLEEMTLQQSTRETNLVCKISELEASLQQSRQDTSRTAGEAAKQRQQFDHDRKQGEAMNEELRMTIVTLQKDAVAATTEVDVLRKQLEAQENDHAKTAESLKRLQDDEHRTQGLMQQVEQLVSHQHMQTRHQLMLFVCRAKRWQQRLPREMLPAMHSWLHKRKEIYRKSK